MSKRTPGGPPPHPMNGVTDPEVNRMLGAPGGLYHLGQQASKTLQHLDLLEVDWQGPAAHAYRQRLQVLQDRAWTLRAQLQHFQRLREDRLTGMIHQWRATSSFPHDPPYQGC